MFNASLANIKFSVEPNDQKIQFELLDDAPMMRSVMLAGPSTTSHPWENSIGSHFYHHPTAQATKKLSSESHIDFSNLSYTVTPTSTPLPAPPTYLEPHSCFHSNSNPEVLMTALQQVLASSQVDYQVNTPKHRIKCVTYGAGAVHFRVCFYQSSSAQVLVEFQRRRGCVVNFNQLYQTVLTKLGSHVQSNSQRAPQFTPPVRAALPEPDQQEVVRSLELLIDMANGPQVDMQREACQGLVFLSQLTIFPETIAQIDVAQFVPVLGNLMQSNEDDIVHSTAAFMHNCLNAKSDSFEQALLNSVVPNLFELLKQPLNYANKDTQRFLTHAVLVLCDKHASSFTVYRDVLSSFKQCGDERIMSNVVSSLNLINAC